MLTSLNASCLNKKPEEILKNKAEKDCLNYLMKAMKILIMTSFSATAPDQDLIFQLQRKMSAFTEEVKEEGGKEEEKKSEEKQPKKDVKKE